MKRPFLPSVVEVAGADIREISVQHSGEIDKFLSGAGRTTFKIPFTQATQEDRVAAKLQGVLMFDNEVNIPVSDECGFPQDWEELSKSRVPVRQD